MIDLITKIKNSQPTLTGEDAATIFTDIVMNRKWVVASSAIFPMEELMIYVNTFIENMANIEVHGQNMFTVQPIHVLYVDDLILQDGFTKMWGLLYANGAVCYSEKENGTEPFMVLFIDQALVDDKDVVEIPIHLDSVHENNTDS